MVLLSRERSPLHIPELFHFIIGYLAEPGPPHGDTFIMVQPPQKEGQRALAALARTCRAFSKPSLDCLWRKLGSLMPLLRCFTTTEDLATRDPPTQAEWAIIHHYSHRIEELEVGVGDPSVFLLECSIFETNLLPNLVVLIWHAACDPIILIQPLLSPKLSSLDLVINSGDPPSGARTVTSFLKILPSRCPGLKVISVWNVEDDMERITTVLSRAICGFERLGRVTICHPLDVGALRHLVMSPQLTELILIFQNSHFEELCIPPTDIPFSGVKKIDISGPDIRCIASLLRSKHQMFSVAEFSSHEPSTSQTIYSFFTVLVSQPRILSLTSITLSRICFNSRERNDIYYDLSHHTLQPLTLLCNLRELQINLENSISLNDEELVGLAHGWPLLQVLVLCSMDGSSAKHLTFKGLLLLSVACPKLQRVTLGLDGREIPTGGVDVDACGVAVEEMCFHRSPIVEPSLVAAFLLNYFPSVDVTVVGLLDGSDVYTERWVQVRWYLDKKNDVSLVTHTKPSC